MHSRLVMRVALGSKSCLDGILEELEALTELPEATETPMVEFDMTERASVCDLISVWSSATTTRFMNAMRLVLFDN
jgi:hypothetical protein